MVKYTFELQDRTNDFRDGKFRDDRTRAELVKKLLIFTPTAEPADRQEPIEALVKKYIDEIGWTEKCGKYDRLDSYNIGAPLTQDFSRYFGDRLKFVFNGSGMTAYPVGVSLHNPPGTEYISQRQLIVFTKEKQFPWLAPDYEKIPRDINNIIREQADFCPQNPGVDAYVNCGTYDGGVFQHRFGSSTYIAIPEHQITIRSVFLLSTKK